MSNLTCKTCGHRFHADQAKAAPDWLRMAGFLAAGVALLAVGGGMIFAYFFLLDHIKLALYGPLFLLGSGYAFYDAYTSRKAGPAACPACGQCRDIHVDFPSRPQAQITTQPQRPA